MACIRAHNYFVHFSFSCSKYRVHVSQAIQMETGGSIKYQIFILSGGFKFSFPSFRRRACQGGGEFSPTSDLILLEIRAFPKIKDGDGKWVEGPESENSEKVLAGAC